MKLFEYLKQHRQHIITLARATPCARSYVTDALWNALSCNDELSTSMHRALRVDVDADLSFEQWRELFEKRKGETCE